MQVIGTEAQGDTELLRELSADLAEASAPGSPFLPATAVVTTNQSSAGSPLTEQTLKLQESLAEPGVTVQPLEALTTEAVPVEPTPTATAEPTATALAVASTDGCLPAVSGPYCVYTVQEDDTLSQIAETLGIESTVAFSGAELLALSNGLNDAQNWVIVPGQELRVPVESGVIHTVSESDSLSRIAEIYGVSTADIANVNGLADPNHVPVGEEIIVPSPSLWPWSGPGDTAAAVESPEPTEEATATAETEETEAPTEVALAAQESPETPTEEPTEAPSPTDEPEATQEPEPAQALRQQRTASAANANPSVNSVRDQFAAGYIAAGGPPQYLEHILGSVIGCESGYNVRAYNPAGPFYGLMQFLPQTWANTGGGDWFDAWQQGHNTGVLLQGSTPASQWPHCWHA